MNDAFLFSVLHFRLPAAILNFAHAQIFDRSVALTSIVLGSILAWVICELSLFDELFSPLPQ